METRIGFVWEVRLRGMKRQPRCSVAQGKWPDLLPGLFPATHETKLCAGSCQYHYFWKDKKGVKTWHRGRWSESRLSSENALLPSLSLSPGLSGTRQSGSHCLCHPGAAHSLHQAVSKAHLCCFSLKKCFPACSEYSRMVPEALETGQAKDWGFWANEKEPKIQGS